MKNLPPYLVIRIHVIKCLLSGYHIHIQVGFCGNSGHHLSNLIDTHILPRLQPAPQHRFQIFLARILSRGSAVVYEVTVCCHWIIFVDFEELIQFRICQVQFFFHDWMQPESENVLTDIFIGQVSKQELEESVCRLPYFLDM